MDGFSEENHACLLSWMSEIEEENRVTIKKFYPDGKLKFLGQWKDGKPHGVMEVYYPNGQLCSRFTWFEGEASGVQESYNCSGMQEYYFVK